MLCRAAGWGLAAAVAGCGLPEPAELVRVAGASPLGAGAPVEVAVEVRFTGPVGTAGVVDGARVVLVPEAARAAALDAVESDPGAAHLLVGVPAEATLVDGGRRAVLVPRAPLRGRSPYLVVVGARLADREGRPVLDAEGRRRASVFAFRTAAPPGPPPVPVLTELRADAEAPEAGGEYAEIANRGDGALDLFGWRLEKRTASGYTASCLVDAPLEEPVPPGGAAIVAGGAWDRRYPAPADAPVLRCGATALLGGLSNDEPPSLALLDPDGAVVSTFGTGGTTPRCPEAAVRLDPEGDDTPANLACAGGSPGWVEW